MTHYLQVEKPRALPMYKDGPYGRKFYWKIYNDATTIYYQGFDLRGAFESWVVAYLSRTVHEPKKPERV